MVACLTGLMILTVDSVSITMSGHGPENDILIAKPTLTWKVWPKEDNLVSAATIMIDGKKQKASYSKLDKSLFFTPVEPFSPGEHQVQAQIIVNGWAKFDKKWTFKVLPEAYSELPSPTTSSRAVVDAFNEIRKIAGLEPAVIDSRLCLSAAGHAAYLTKNPTDGHYEAEGRPGFLGREPAHRMGKMGFAGGCWEVLVPGSDEIEIGVKRLFDAPYHRAAMLNAGSIKVGGGYVGGMLVIDGEAANDPRTVLSPADGQQNVQSYWKDTEVPDPFRIHTAKSRLVGYPIMFVRQGSSQLTVRSFVLRDDRGNRVEAYENFPGYDNHLDAEAFIMPKKPLEPGKTYRATIDATDEDGKQVGRSWTFTTSASDQSSARTVASLQDALGIDLARPEMQLRRR